MQTTTSRLATDGDQRGDSIGRPKTETSDQVRKLFRAGHYSKCTAKTYVDWINSFFICNFSSVIEGRM